MAVSDSKIKRSINTNAKKNYSSGSTNTAVHEEMRNAAAAGDWDKVGNLSNGLLTPTNRTDEAGVQIYDTTAADTYMQQLAKEYNVDFNDYIGKKYDATYGAGAYDGGTGTGKPVYNDYSKALVAQYNANQAANAKQNGSAAVGGVSAGGAASSAAGGLTTDLIGGNTSSMTNYLQEMYAKNLEAELSALKSAYDSNVSELEAQNDAIAEQYRAAQRQAAAQNQLEIQSMNERALATGLNTGTSGQLALAQSVAHQNNIGSLLAQEARDQAESERLLAQLMREYNSGVTQATANANAQLAQALYNEIIRQQGIDAQNKANTRAEVLSMISGGVTPSEAMLAAAGMTPEEALLWAEVAKKAAAQKTAGNVVKPKEYEPPLTYEQMFAALEDGIVNNGVKETYEYYYKEPYPEEAAAPAPKVDSTLMDYSAIGDVDLNALTNGQSANGITLAKQGGGTQFVSWGDFEAKLASGEVKVRSAGNGKYTMVAVG